jgi:Family of unknown function (DUF5682)
VGIALDSGVSAASEAIPRALEELAGSTAPHLIGIRHHSPTLAAAVPELLDAGRPDLILLEMAEELQPWIEWLGSPDLVAPVALAAARRDGQGLLFYPLADFSPELAVIRWARAHAVEVRAFDLPLALSEGETLTGRSRLELPGGGPELLTHLSEQFDAPDGDELWDRMVEVRAAGSPAEAVRRAGLLVGWTLRLQAEAACGASAHDLRREAWMRYRLSEALQTHQRLTAVIGAFHGPALLRTATGAEPSRTPVEVVTSMVPYTFALLDSRSGYPAGIRDPEWQQAFWAGGCTPAAADRSLVTASLGVCRELRQRGHPAGVPDARETVRFARDLARLRSLPGPGRRELVESLQTCLAQGEPLGRGRAVAAAMQTVLVGGRRGTLPEGAPRSGLAPHIERHLAELRLPGPANPAEIEIRLDPLRSDLDRRREIAIQRMRVCGIPYADPLNAFADDTLTVTRRWLLAWGPASSALVEVAAVYGVTLEQAALGRLRHMLARARYARGMAISAWLEIVSNAAEAGLTDFTWTQLRDLIAAGQHQAGLTEIVQTIDLVDRLEHGHVPGLVPGSAQQDVAKRDYMPALITAAVRQVEGLSGSNRVEDARALLSLVQRDRAAGSQLIGQQRLRHALEQLSENGSPLMQGTASALRVVLGFASVSSLGERLGSWVDAASDRSAQSALAMRLRGALLAAAPILQAAPEISRALVERVAALDTPAFLRRLPALRDGFEVLSPADRCRFLDAIRDRLGDATVDLRLDYSSDMLSALTEADVYGRLFVEKLDGEVLEWLPTT